MVHIQLSLCKIKGKGKFKLYFSLEKNTNIDHPIGDKFGFNVPTE